MFQINLKSGNFANLVLLAEEFPRKLRTVIVQKIMMDTCIEFINASNKLASEVSSNDAVIHVHESALGLLTACTGDQAVVDLFINMNIIPTIADICQVICTSKSLKDSSVIEAEQDRKNEKNLVVRLCRLYSNFTACGETSRAFLFRMIPDNNAVFEPLTHILSAAVMSESRLAVAAVVGSLYNCLQSTVESNSSVLLAVKQRRNALCSSRGFLCQLLLSVIPNNKLNLTGDSTGSSSEATEDPALEWFHMLAFLFVKHSMFSHIYTLVRPTSQSKQAGKSDMLPVSHEQLAVGVLEDPYCVGKLTEEGSEEKTAVFTPSEDSVGTGGMLDLLLTLAGDISDIAMDRVFLLSSTTTSNAGEEEDAVDAAINALEHRMRRSLTQDFLPLALQVLASTLAVAPPESGRYLRAALVQQTALLESLVRLLGVSFLHKNAGRQGRVEKLASAGGSTSVSSGEVAPPPPPPGRVAVAPVDLDRLRECVRLALQLLGNLVYSCDSAKDALQTSGALAAVLSHCGTDFENPISREWALLCVRNACEAHSGNQAFIQALQPQEVSIQDDKLRAQGLKVEMNAQTGKFKFVHTEPSPAAVTPSTSNNNSISSSETTAADADIKNINI